MKNSNEMNWKLYVALIILSLCLLYALRPHAKAITTSNSSHSTLPVYGAPSGRTVTVYHQQGGLPDMRQALQPARPESVLQ